MAEEQENKENATAPQEGDTEQNAKDQKEDTELKSLVRMVTETNKKLDDEYDDKLKVIDAKKKMIPTDESAEEAHNMKVQALKDKYGELKARISNARRSGKDPLIADYLSRSIPSKIRMAEITREAKDFEAAEFAIKRATEELEEAEKEVLVNVKKEIDERLKQELQKETGQVIEEED